MRISKAALMSRWAWSTGLGLIVFAVLFFLDLRLKTLAGVDTADLQSFTTAAQYQAALWAWSKPALAMRAGFDFGLDYLLMPLYAISFYYSGIIAAEAFAPGPGRLRRILLLAAMVPVAGALCDAVENALELSLLLGGASDSLTAIAATVSNAKTAALTVGGVLLAAAFAGRLQQRRKARASGITL